MSLLEELVEGAREDSRRRAEDVSLESLRERLEGRGGARPFNEALVRPGLSLTILRKDFIVDRYQLYEAAANGADAVLLIVAALDDEELAELYAEARSIDLDCLVEVHDEAELERALAIDADVLGINNRNLDDFAVDIETTVELLTDVPAGKAVVSESGYGRREQLDELERIGVDAVLVGEALMRAEDAELLVRELTRDEEATREHYMERASEE